MIITDSMTEYLSKIIQRAPQLNDRVNGGNLSDEQIAKELIDLYRATDDLDVRQNIMEFMTDAGYVWLRKLFTRDDTVETAAA